MHVVVDVAGVSGVSGVAVVVVVAVELLAASSLVEGPGVVATLELAVPSFS